jgi:hypothetical protein
MGTGFLTADIRSPFASPLGYRFIINRTLPRDGIVKLSATLAAKVGTPDLKQRLAHE